MCIYIYYIYIHRTYVTYASIYIYIILMYIYIYHTYVSVFKYLTIIAEKYRYCTIILSLHTTHIIYI